MFGRKSEGRAPIDLPRRYWWARDELVDLRMRNHELRVENMRLRMDLVKARGGSAEELSELFRAVLEPEKEPIDE